VFTAASDHFLLATRYTPKITIIEIGLKLQQLILL